MRHERHIAGIQIGNAAGEDFLNLYGYDVLVASHPDTAFKRLKQSAASLDAMILDIGLDDNRSGLEVLELMRLDDRFVNLPGYERVFNRLAEIIAPISSRQSALPKATAAR